MPGFIQHDNVLHICAPTVRPLLFAAPWAAGVCLQHRAGNDTSIIMCLDILRHCRSDLNWLERRPPAPGLENTTRARTSQGWNRVLRGTSPRTLEPDCSCHLTNGIYSIRSSLVRSPTLQDPLFSHCGARYSTSRIKLGRDRRSARKPSLVRHRCLVLTAFAQKQTWVFALVATYVTL